MTRIRRTLRQRVPIAAFALALAVLPGASAGAQQVTGMLGEPTYHPVGTYGGVEVAWGVKQDARNAPYVAVLKLRNVSGRRLEFEWAPTYRCSDGTTKAGAPGAVTLRPGAVQSGELSGLYDTPCRDGVRPVAVSLTAEATDPDAEQRAQAARERAAAHEREQAAALERERAAFAARQQEAVRRAEAEGAAIRERQRLADAQREAEAAERRRQAEAQDAAEARRQQQADVEAAARRAERQRLLDEVNARNAATRQATDAITATATGITDLLEGRRRERAADADRRERERQDEQERVARQAAHETARERARDGAARADEVAGQEHYAAMKRRRQQREEDDAADEEARAAERAARWREQNRSGRAPSRDSAAARKRNTATP